AAYRRIKIISKAIHSTQNRKVFHSSVYGTKETVTAFSVLTDVQTTDDMPSAVKCTMEGETLISDGRPFFTSQVNVLREGNHQISMLIIMKLIACTSKIHQFFFGPDRQNNLLIRHKNTPLRLFFTSSCI